MKEKKACISCNCKTKLYAYPFLLPITFMFLRYIREKMFEKSRPERSYIILKYNLPLLFYYYLPKILTLLFIPIIKFNTKGESDNIEKRNSLRQYHIIKENEGTKKTLLLIYFISLLEVIFEDCDYLLYYYQKIGSLNWLVEKKTGHIIFVSLFLYFILGKELHRHHFFALILGFIGACIVNICRFPLGFSKIEEYPFHLINIFISSLFSLAIVLIKYLFSKYVILSPYLFIFYDGVFNIINSIICVLAQYFILINLNDEKNKSEDKNYFKNNFLEIFTIFKGQNSKFYIYFFAFFVLSFGYHIFNVLTIYHYSPYLIVLVELCLPIDNDIFYIIFNDVDEKDRYKNNVIKRFIIQSIGYVFLSIGALILNEIILLNFCGCNRNTYVKISIRGTLDPFSVNDLNDTNLNSSSIASEEEL